LENFQVALKPPEVSNKRYPDIEKALSVTTPTANTLIREFERLGLLREITGQQRGRTYAFDRYLKNVQY